MKILAIDGNSIINRAFYGIRLLSNKKGVFTNALTGFFNIYLKLLKEESPDGVAVAFDLKAPTFRHKKYDGYKAGRKGMPDELAAQMPYLKEILTAMGIKIIEVEGFEADDILGTIAEISEENSADCTILTGDRDSFQLVSDRVKVHLASTKADLIYTPAAIQEQYGVSPKQMIEVKALMGDASDNIPGVAGIGEKTALSLIQKYGSVDKIYEDIQGLDVSAGVKTKLENGKASAYLSRELAVICRDVPIEKELSAYKPSKPDEEKLSAILTELEMFALLKKLDIKAGAADKTHEKAVEPPMLSGGFDVIFDGGKLLRCDGKTAELVPDEKAADFLSKTENLRTFNLKSLWHWALEKGFRLGNVRFDTTLAAYLLNVNSSEYSLERLCAEYGIAFSDSAELPAAILRLNSVLLAKIQENGLLSVLEDIEMPLAEVLSAMEIEGIELDSDGVKAFGERLGGDIAALEGEIYGLAGREFNIGSPKQLGVVLFDDLGLPSGKKTKTGYSTNADVLEFLMDKHPIIAKIQEYRSLSKLKSTYTDGLLAVVGEDGRIHSTFRQTETRTGRISSVEPNIQNIPVRTEIGRNMRRFFVAKQGYKLVDADYSQIELRVLAAISGDEHMQEAFKNNLDIHTATASKVFNQPPEWVTPELRSRAKAVNFGIVYGIGSFSLSKDINVSVKEADGYIKEYFANYPKIKEYMDKTVMEASKNGWVSTAFGRRRFIPELLSSNKIVQANGKRIAMNTPIQGTAADIIKLAMIRVYRRLAKSGLDARLILQVHDELIVEARADQAEQAAVILKEEMEGAAKLAVPLVADVRIGATWYDAH